MKKIFLPIFLCVLCSALFAQTPTGTWGKSYGGVYNENDVHFAMDLNKSIYLAGDFLDTLIDFNPGVGVNKLSPAGSYISKLDSTGNFVWVKRIGTSYLSDIETDSLGNFYLYGCSKSGNTADIDPGVAVYNVTDSTYIAKYDPSGNFLWAKKFPTIYPGHVIFDNSGNIIISGRFSGGDFDPGVGVSNLYTTSGSAEYFLCKLNASGNYIWAKAIPYGGAAYQTLNIAADISGNVYFLGNFVGTSDVDPGPSIYNFTSIGWNDIFVGKLNASGSFVWADHFWGPSSNIVVGYSNSLVVDETGEVFFTVRFNNYVDFDPSSGSLVLGSSSSDFDIALCRLNSNGGLVWAKAIGDAGGNEQVFSISMKNNKVYLTGQFQSSFGTDFNGGIGSQILYSNASSYDVFVCEYDTYGNFSKTCSFGSSASDTGYEIIAHEDGAVYVSGHFTGGFIFNPNISLGSNGAGDIFICKLKGFNSYTYVWPGDANSDGIADNIDVLELGLQYTQTGTPRASTSNNWQSYFSNNWTGTITNGKNLNHSDCNGDGIINDNDTLAIYNNYGLNHAFKPAQTNTVNPQISIVPDQAAVAKGAWGTASVYLGDATTNINNINGVAFTIDFDNSLIETNNIYIEYQNSFLDAGQNLKFRKLDFANSKLFTATTHTVNNNVSGYGKIATLHYQIKSSLTTDQVLNLGISQANQSDASGTIVPLTSGTATLMAMGTSAGLQELSGSVVSMNPNPTNGSLTINSKTELQKIEVVSITGTVLLSEFSTNISHTLNLENFGNGMYFVNVYQNNRIVKRERVVLNK